MSQALRSQGKDKVRTYLKENPEVANEIDAKIRAKLLPEIGVSDDEPEVATEEA